MSADKIKTIDISKSKTEQNYHYEYIFYILKDIKYDLRNFQKETKDQFIAINNKIDEYYRILDSKIDSNYNTLDKKIDANYKALDDKITTVYHKLDDKITTVYHKLDDKITTVYHKLDEKIDTKIDGVNKLLFAACGGIILSILMPIIIHFI